MELRKTLKPAPLMDMVVHQQMTSNDQNKEIIG